MANSTRTQKARYAASSVGSNEYVRRLMEDEELLQLDPRGIRRGPFGVRPAAEVKRPATALMDDKKVHRELRDAAESLREASDPLRGAARRRARSSASCSCWRSSARPPR